MTDPEPTTETWLYAGKRLDQKDRPYEVWHDGHKLLQFTKLGGLMPGHAYLVEVIRTADRVSVRGVPRYAGTEADREPTQKQIDEWRAEDRAARAIIEGKLVERNAHKDDELEQALEVVRRHYDRLRTMSKRGAFISYVTGEMTRPPAKRNQEED